MNEELRDLAEIALRIAKADLERDGSVTALFILRDPDGSTHQLPFTKEYAYLMNHGEAKDAIFGMIRSLARARGATATIFAVEAWFGKQTDKGRALPPKEFHRRVQERAFDGLVERSQAIVVTVQTPTHAMTVHQEFERDDKRRRIHYGERQESIGPIDTFAGRQKMFGDLREEKLVMTPPRAPGFWRDETSGVLAPVVMRYLEGADLSAQEVVTLRAYLAQWIDATVWDENPHADREARRALARLRRDVRHIITRTGIDRWLFAALDFGIDPF